MSAQTAYIQGIKFGKRIVLDGALDWLRNEYAKTNDEQKRQLIKELAAVIKGENK